MREGVGANMGYPEPPDFTSGDPLAAHWAVTLSGGRLQRMASQGETVIKKIQQALNTLGIQVGASATALRAGPVAVDGVMGWQTMTGLLRLAQQMQREQPDSGWQTIIERLTADIAARRIDALALRIGLWAAYVRTVPATRTLGYEVVSLPANARLPVWGQGADDDRNAGGPEGFAVQWIEGVQPPPPIPARAGPAPAERRPLGTLAPPAVRPPVSAPTPPEGLLDGEIMGVDKKLAAGGAVVALLLIFSTMDARKQRKRARSAERSRENLKRETEATR